MVKEFYTILVSNNIEKPYKNVKIQELFKVEEWCSFTFQDI